MASRSTIENGAIIASDIPPIVVETSTVRVLIARLLAVFYRGAVGRIIINAAATPRRGMVIRAGARIRITWKGAKGSNTFVKSHTSQYAHPFYIQRRMQNFLMIFGFLHYENVP